MKYINKLYTKYHLSDETDDGQMINLFAKISDDKVTLRNYLGKKTFEFTCSDKEKVKTMLELILKAIK